MHVFTPAQNLSRAPTPALPPVFRAPLFPPPSPRVLSLVATLNSARPLDVAVVCVAVCCSVLQGVAVCCIVLSTRHGVSQLQHTATRCNALQRNETHCNVLQHTATHYNALQHTVTHCNTLQHTATQL